MESRNPVFANNRGFTRGGYATFDTPSAGQLQTMYDAPSATALQTGRMTLDEAVARTVQRTRALARRQLAWFRRDPRIRWFRAGPEGAAGIVDELTEHLRDG